MSEQPLYEDLRQPYIGGDLAAVTLAATYKALYPARQLAALSGKYFSRQRRTVRIRLFGRITTVLTPGNLTIALLYGTGADANGVSIVASAPQTLLASQTDLAWMVELYVQCRSIGPTGTLFATGLAHFNPAVIAVGHFLLPASAPAPSGACDLTAPLILSVQALRSGSTAETMQVHDTQVEAI